MARTEHRVAEHEGKTVLECFDPQTPDDLPDARPGTRILREDGNVYTLADDEWMLIDDEGYFVSPFGLHRWKKQELIGRVVSITAGFLREGIDMDDTN